MAQSVADHASMSTTTGAAMNLSAERRIAVLASCERLAASLVDEFARAMERAEHEEERAALDVTIAAEVQVRRRAMRATVEEAQKLAAEQEAFRLREQREYVSPALFSRAFPAQLSQRARGPREPRPPPAEPDYYY